VTTDEITEEIDAVFTRAGASARFHAIDLASTKEVGIEPDELVVTASVFKVPVLVELMRRGFLGELDLTERVVVPASRRTMGPTGLSVMLDDLEISVRDLAFFMMSVSDNTATDVLMERLGGPTPINLTMVALGLPNTVLTGDCEVLLRELLEDLGVNDGRDDEDISIATMPPARFAHCRSLIAAKTNRTTPREMTTLLRLIWEDAIGAPGAGPECRRILGLQVWPHRLSSGFPDGVKLSAKTGTLPGIRNEAGVIEYADGGRYAVAAFTTAESYASQQPSIDAAIGTAARLAVDHLRSM
jgi:beta-lactamase class A